MDYLSVVFPQSQIISLKSARVFHSELYTPIEEVANVVTTVKRRGLPCSISVPNRNYFVTGENE